MERGLGITENPMSDILIRAARKAQAAAKRQELLNKASVAQLKAWPTRG